MGIWVDTDFGFDDLWALLVLRQLGVTVDGVSLVAGNSTLDQACRNASGAASVFNLAWPVAKGAARPLARPLETAERVLGPMGMQSRGEFLPQDTQQAISEDAVADIGRWLSGNGQNEILAIGPLTNLAMLYETLPEKVQQIDRIVWMGGSSGRGNHTPFAEYNALADPEALALLLDRKAPLRIVDLEICRRAVFGQKDMPNLTGNCGTLLNDLLGGYLDIGLSRGRDGMAIYDPVAALAMAPDRRVRFRRSKLSVCLDDTDELGRTIFDHHDPAPNVEVAVDIDETAAVSTCLLALQKEAEGCQNPTT